MKEMTIQTGTGKVTHKVRREDCSKPDVWHNDALVWHMVLKDTDAVLSKVSQCPHTGRDSSSERCIWRRPN